MSLNAIQIRLDPLSVAPWAFWRYSLRSWTFDGPAFLAGALLVSRGDFVEMPVDNVKNLPLVSKLERLAILGWGGTHGSHEKHLPDTHDLRLSFWPGWDQSPMYFSCLLDLDSLFQKGLQFIAPGQQKLLLSCVCKC